MAAATTSGGPPDSIVRAVIRGRVQGVWFRAWTVEMAQSLGLAGWVRNRRDGSVEALFAGPADAVAAMLEKCRDGPPAARVDAVDRHDVDSDEVSPDDLSGFRQLPTD